MRVKPRRRCEINAPAAAAALLLEPRLLLGPRLQNRACIGILGCPLLRLLANYWGDSGQKPCAY
jgi:hypothetical protein